MKITVLVNRDLPSNFALNLLLPELAENHEVRLFFSARVGGSKKLAPELGVLKFFEQTLFGELLFPALDSRAAPLPSQAFRSFEALGELTADPPEILNRVNAPESLRRFRDTEPDLVISIRYGSILKAEAIAVPRHGVINLHSGLLPAYRGVMATFWALLAEEKEIGTTLHTIDDGTIDTGRVLGKTRLAVEPGRSYLWHVLRLYPEGCQRILEAVETIARGETPPSRPQEEGGAYFTFPSSEDLQRFEEAGHRLVDYDEITEFARQYLPR